MRAVTRLSLACCLAALPSSVVCVQASFAQANGPLNFGQNYFVRGDFVVAGAYGLNTSFGADGFGTGTIKIPDANPGITGVNSVPADAEVIAAVLYWQTVEKVGTVPGQPGTGQNGFFRPVFKGGPAKGYAISGVPLPSDSTVGWSAGGCTGTSTGKLVRTYRANVVTLLPRNANGNISANGTYEVRLPNVGNNTPLTLGASLVLVYRKFDPAAPLNAIVIYDGAFNPGGALLTMTQIMQIFDATHAPNIPVSRIAHIVADGKINKFQSVKLNGVTLPSLYGRTEPPFPGYYGTWDNPIWTFPSGGVLANFKNPVNQADESAETQVVPSTSNAGCVSWGAVIISTTVQNSDGDGLLDVWKLPKAPKDSSRPGYCDPAVNEGACTQGDPNWVDLPNAKQGEKDIYLQFDYMCSSPNPDGNTCLTGDPAGNYSFEPTLRADPADGKTAIQKVQAVYASHGFTLHANEQFNPPNQPNAHAIQEESCQDTVVNGKQFLCIFPNPPGTTINKGVVAWPGGVSGFERELINPSDPTNVAGCVSSPPSAGCVPRFQPAAAPSKRYGLFAHAVGQPKWNIYNGTLASVTQTGNTVTFTASAALGALNVLGKDANGKAVNDPTCPNGRITVVGAATNQNLNETFCVASLGAQGNSFTITVGGSPVNASYTLGTDPNLAVVPAFTSTASGIADVGGHHFVVSLGLWGNPASSSSDGQNPSVIASTLMHEQGHAIFTLAHGGPAAGALDNAQLLQSVNTNCKVNYLSVMSYSRQLDLLNYSETVLPDIDKATLSGSLSGLLDITHWYVPWPAAVDATGKAVGSPAAFLCTGPPKPAGETPMTRVTGPASTFAFASLSGANTDINFDGSISPNTSENFLGACDWCTGGYDLGQTDATGAYLSTSGPPFGGGGPPFGGGGPPFGGGGPPFGGGGPPFGGGGPPFGGGGPPFGGGGPPFGGGGEIDLGTAQSITPPPQNVTATEANSARTITLTWVKPFGDIGSYNVYRSADGGNTFTGIATVNAPTVTYTDTVTCNTTGYKYYVTAVQSAASTNPGAESTPSGTVSTILPDAIDPVTGCYIVTGFSSPASAVQGSSVQIAWTLTDDFYPTNGSVSRQAANTLVAIGPLPNTCAIGRTTLLANGVPTTTADVFSNSGDQFTFTWNGTDAFCAGSYTFELDLDHVQASPAQIQTTTVPLQLGIDVNDTDSTPHIPAVALAAGTVGLAYNYTLTEDGGTAPFKWTFSGSLPTGISQPSLYSPTLFGTACVAGNYNFTATVTDSAAKPNSGTEPLTLQINVASSTTGVASSANPSVFGQPVTFTVTVSPQYSCTPTGTVTLYVDGNSIGSNSLSGGMATFTTSTLSVGNHNITASYGGDANFTGSNSNSTPLTQTVNKAMTAATINLVSPSPAFVGQAITVGYSLAVVAPGAGVPTGTVTVLSSDGSSCVAAVPGPGACVLSPAPTAAGVVTFNAAYSGDSNFVASMVSGGYTVYELVFSVQPSNTLVGQTMTPAVQVAAQDGSNNTLTSFTGGISLAINSGSGTLSGTTTQNASNGVATFGNLSISKVATGDTLVASLSGGVAPVVSSAFNVTLSLNYTLIPSTNSPSTRCCAAIAFDPNSNSTLLFGGNHPVMEGVQYAEAGDTWKLQNGQWTPLSPVTSPPVRSGASMVYDAANNNLVLFGGTTGSSDLNDTWIWDGSNWTLANDGTSNSPPGRRFDSQGMAYDTNMPAVVMFGGIDYTNAVFFNDTWVWNGTTKTWTQMYPVSSPSPRRTVLATDPSGNVMLFGGTGSSGNLADTWVWDGTNWNLQSPAASPSARDMHNMAFNPNVGAVVLFAGYGGLNDVWTWDGTNWTQTSPSAPTPERYAFGMDYDSAADGMFVFGGFSTGPAINDTWEFTVGP